MNLGPLHFSGDITLGSIVQGIILVGWMIRFSSRFAIMEFKVNQMWEKLNFDEIFRHTIRK